VHHDGCDLKPVWAGITDMINTMFDKVPLSALLNGSLDVRFVQISGRHISSRPAQAALKS